MKTSKIGQFYLSFSVIILALNSCYSQSPGGISAGLSIWLKANAGTNVSGVNLTGWVDQSGTLTPVTINGSPDFINNGYNFNPYIDFTLSAGNGGDFLRIPNANFQSFFWVAKINDSNRSYTHLATYDGVSTSQPCAGCALSGGANGGTVAQYGEFGYGNGFFQNAGNWRKNGQATGISYNTPHSGNYDIVTALGNGPAAVNTFMGGQNSVGNWFDGRTRDWFGPVGEIIAYSGAISIVDANKIESYLAIKYGITLGGNGSTTLFYTSPSGTNLWSAATGFHNDIAGIGSDVISENLNQPKSHSINTPSDIITMANSNFSNPITMNDGDYLLWGNNDSTLTYNCLNFTHAGESISSLLNRKWRTQKTGVPSGNVIIEFNMESIQGSNGLGSSINADVRLLIDDNSDFTDGSIGEYTIAPLAGYSTTGNNIYFSVPYSFLQNGQGFLGLALTTQTNSIIDAGEDTVICSGISTTITATGGVSYFWDNGLGNGSTFSVSPTVTTTYTVTGINDLGCIGIDQVIVTVNTLPTATISGDTVICSGETTPLTLSGTPNSTVSYSLNNGTSQNSTITLDNTGIGTINTEPLTTTTTFTLTEVISNVMPFCTQNLNSSITIIPELPVATFTPDVMVGCSPLIVNFTNSTLNSLNCDWDFGDGYTTTDCGVVTHTYTAEETCFDVTLSIVTATGCNTSLTLNDLICVEANPTASFSLYPSELSFINQTSTMINESSGATSYTWNFGDGTNSITQSQSMSGNYSHLFNIEGKDLISVELIAISENGCMDTTYRNLIINNELYYYIPNTFTPDDNKFNQTFQPILMDGTIPYEFNMQIFNRWGESIFETNDINIGWDGTCEGEILQDGTYTWLINFKINKTDESKQEIGHVNLLR